MSLTVRRYNSAVDRDMWDSFVDKEARNATFLHLRDYMDYHSDRFADNSLIVEAGGRTVALLPGCALDNGIFSSHAGLTYGGLLMSPRLTQQMAIDAFGEINAVLRSDGFVRAIYKPVPHIYHRTPAEEDLYALFHEGLGLTLQGRSPSAVVMMADRLGLTENRRRGVKKALARGVRIVESADFSDFWKILTDNLEYRHGAAPVHTLSEIELLHGRFPERIRLFEARGADGSALAGCVIYDCGTVWHTQYISASEAGRECAALDLLLSTLLDKCPARYFDFGTSTEHGGRYLNAGLIHQKEGFGGRAVTYDTWMYSLL
ncbi:MAG: GNAT family N-acetyltransferase [Muribaculaceae bacterium]|nr:GNAT family N-acetyltransferase [Muribaculaceae bacterium]